ncbi:hypothetical protein HMPREF1248_1493 [Coriobacteriaceae bacterium BV3Ac1]|nr:hypothetical protein HMPREF1248_1493 [Coriobacteriaceae bacterium BV3Ac1]
MISGYVQPGIPIVFLMKTFEYKHTRSIYNNVSFLSDFCI